MKKFLFSLSVMVVLYFIWWFSGGTIWGGYLSNSPYNQTVLFVRENFNLGLATIFKALNNSIGNF
jgi:hypothetical protein